jgi:hypothetical protein
MSSYFENFTSKKQSDAFYNIEAYQLISRKVVTHPLYRAMFNFETSKWAQDFSREQYIKVTPITLSNNVYASGGYMDYDLP